MAIPYNELLHYDVNKCTFSEILVKLHFLSTRRLLDVPEVSIFRVKSPFLPEVLV